MIRDGLSEDDVADERREDEDESGDEGREDEIGDEGREDEDEAEGRGERLTADLRDAAACLAQARRVVVYSGAGVSKESGISTFRDRDEGLWAKYDPMELATAAAYARDPAFVWGWYMDRFGLIEQAAPNPGHHALAELERLVALTVVTQNIDGLHQRAGSRDVIELHGSALRFKCVSGAARRLHVWPRSRAATRLRLAAPAATPTSAPTSSGSARRCRATPSNEPSTWRRAATC